MSALSTFIAKYGKEGLKMLAEHKGMAAAGAAGMAGAAGLGAYAGMKETKKAIPGALLQKLGLPPEWADQGEEAVNDAMKYAEKNPVAAAGIGGAAGMGLKGMMGDTMDSDVLRQILGMKPRVNQ